MRVLRWLLHIIFHNAGWKLLALGIALGLWGFVSSEPEVSTFATAKVEYRNMPDDLDIASPPVETVTLELRGPSGELGNLAGAQRPSVMLDMQDAAPGERTFPINQDTVRMPPGIQLIRSVPAQVRFAFDRRATRTVPVRIRFTGEGDNGYIVGRYTASPGQVRITGPANHVGRTQYVSTDAVNVGSTVGTSEFRVNAFVDDAFVRLLDSPEISVNVTMRKK